MAEPGNADFIPLIFAADINVYSLARAFHEQYGIVSAAIGKVSSGPLHYSSIVKYQLHPRADAAEVLPALIQEFSEQHPNQKILVFGCGDNYVRQISLAKPLLPANVVVPYLDFAQLDQLANKRGFYSLCDQLGIAHPLTFIYAESTGGCLRLDFPAPYIVKPANSVDWWEHPFQGQRKVHIVDSLTDLKTLLSAIYAGGYRDTMIIQEYIPGADSALRVITQYFDRHGQLRLSSAGRVLLEEHTGHGIGNSAVIITERQDQLAQSLADMLATVGYRGFAAFDIKFDERDQQFKVLEVNTRQGRGNYYVTAAGQNIAKIACDDLVYNLEPQPQMISLPCCWAVVPKKVLLEVAAAAGLRAEVEELYNTGRVFNPLDYAADRSFLRRLWLDHYLRLQGRNYNDWKRQQAKAEPSHTQTNVRLG